MEIILEKYNNIPKINIGSIINDNLSIIEEYAENYKLSITLKICNEVIWGYFIIPDAIGFSTPLDRLGKFNSQDVISIERSGDGTDAFMKYKQWKEIYETSVCRKLKIDVFNCSSDYLKCGICLESYKLQDQLIRVACDHLFHFNCYKNMNMRDPCPYCRKTALLPSLEGLSEKDKFFQVLKEHGY
ncbi:Hypothetical protein HVR_LOCUS405 [uncultured virus]|nr:Hypothetical protein HVR_LOCUS405 [uncultured virus]